MANPIQFNPIHGQSMANPRRLAQLLQPHIYLSQFAHNIPIMTFCSEENFLHDIVGQVVEYG
jgi:hypothetical protein